MYKYIFIVHSETVTRIGKRKTKRLLLGTYFAILVSWTLSLAIRENFGSRKVFQNDVSCGVFHALGTSNREADKQATQSLTRHLFSCSINDLEPNNMGNIVVNILTKILCTSQTIINIVVALNVLEIFFYLRIFRHMNR